MGIGNACGDSMRANIRDGWQPVDLPGSAVHTHTGRCLHETEAQGVTGICIQGKQLNQQGIFRLDLAVTGGKKLGRIVTRCGRHHGQGKTCSGKGSLGIRHPYLDAVRAQHAVVGCPVDHPRVRVDAHATRGGCK